MKRLIGMLTVAGVVAVSGICATAIAADGAGGKHANGGGARHEKQDLTDMTVTGMLSKESKTVKDKTFDVYVVTDATGNKVMLGGRHGDKDGAGDAAVKLADFVGKNVTITGKGFKSAKMTRIVEITKVEAASDAAAAPAAPVAPAVPAAPVAPAAK